MTATNLLQTGEIGASVPEQGRPFRVYTQRDLDRITAIRHLPADQRFAMKVVSTVLPFRVNEYVIERLIDWANVPDDPIFQLTFPQPGMLSPEHYAQVADLLRRDASSNIGPSTVEAELDATVARIREELNPHPAGQRELNTPRLPNGDVVTGLQHKYRETVLFFPSQGQTCHAYCSFCFRWAQFVGDKELRIATNEAEGLHAYLRQHRCVTDLLVTGGDPMVMKTRHLETYLEPLLHRDFDHVQTIRLGTKALSFWPYRFVTDPDSDALLALLERLVAAGKHVALMAHFNHWREMDTDICERAIERIRATGAEVRSQGPLLAHINDDPDAWAPLWRQQVRLGVIPYYMFVERDTGAHHHFKVPLVRAWEVYREAIQQVSGLARTVRGPSMSAGPGKVEITGVTEVAGEKVFVLRFLQARNPDWVNRPFFAQFDPQATWLDELKPAFGESEFFFEGEYRERWTGLLH
ncbi:lysine 2,3-aminomutase [Thiohalocapsa halophila]|uniref:Lysine 2,3-aminomutase n=1 Tax=Thiohalocapsa halophila TaxID=69359 RepID=A0ABS1CCL7_9GAMM|nr:lysine 2,3-aminomutase [Thiohalocapsa halophila]MBK1629562.1 lysine 2,3-aminomutase [Thiohalocapsa halophila]